MRSESPKVEDMRPSLGGETKGLSPHHFRNNSTHKPILNQGSGDNPNASNKADVDGNETHNTKSQKDSEDVPSEHDDDKQYDETGNDFKDKKQHVIEQDRTDLSKQDLGHVNDNNFPTGPAQKT